MSRINRIIMLTTLAICAILILVGCENGKKLESSDEEELANIEKQEEQVLEEKAEVAVPEVYHYNESGKIIIAMYHKFTSRK